MTNPKNVASTRAEWMKPSVVEAEKGIPRQAVYNAGRPDYDGDFPRPVRMMGGLYVRRDELESYIASKARARRAR